MTGEFLAALERLISVCTGLNTCDPYTVVGAAEELCALAPDRCVDANKTSWQPIGTAPKTINPILVLYRGRYTWAWWDDWNGWLDAETLDDMEPTHWIPIPEPPKEETK